MTGSRWPNADFVPLVSIDHLTFTYPQAGQPALRQVSLQIKVGEFVIVAGPSGAGKSTLLRCLNGLVPHFSGGSISGSVTVAGYDAIEVGPQLLSGEVGFVFQSPDSQNVFEHAEAEVAFPLENAGLPVPEMRQRIEEVLGTLDLLDLRNRQLTTLSGGERQLVAIASALTLRPQILVFDEPTSQLDPKSAEEVLQAIVRLNEVFGITIIIAEHRLERVVQYGRRLVYLEDGRIETDAQVRPALAKIPLKQAPPIVQLARRAGWNTVPVAAREARRFANGASMRQHLFSDTALPHRYASDTSSPCLLEARSLFFAYDKRLVLRGADLCIRPGEAVALLGRNGSGKTTLLKCLVGLLNPARGEVLLDGRPTAGKDVAEICRQVAYLPQDPDDLLFAESVADELAATLRNHRLSPENGAFSPESLLASLGLDKLALAYPRDLSVGQRQRVALAALMVTQPRLLLLDEPTRGLDAVSKRDLMALLRRWLLAGIGLLVATHDVEFAARLADRVVVLIDGKIKESGPVTEVMSASSIFAPQVARVFPGRNWITVEDALGESRHAADRSALDPAG